jgi:hypothetical protein
MYFKSIVNEHRYLFYNSKSKDAPGWVSSSDKNLKGALDDNLQTDYHGWALDGFLRGSRGIQIHDLMSAAPDVGFLDDETIGGELCKVVQATTRIGSLTLWLSSTHSHLLKKVVRITGQSHYISDDTTLAAFNKDPAMADLFGFVQLYRVTVEKIGYQNVNGRTVVQSGTATTEHIRNDKSVWANVCVLTRSDFDLKPDFASLNAFEIAVKDATRVNNPEVPASGVQYEWRDGKVVPADVEFAGGGAETWAARSWRTLIVLCAAGLVLLALGIRYFYSLKAKK